MRRLRRVFFSGDIADVIELEDAESRKLKTVLRAETGDTVEILTNTHLLEAEIGIIGKKSIQARILSSRETKKPDYKLTAYQCIAKREYMDFIIEKYTEIGVTDIIPVISSRSMDSIKESTIERYKTIAKEAALQSEKEFITNICKPVKLERIKAESSINILFHERLGKKSMPDISSRDISFIIGAEGGFTEKEFNHIIYQGFEPYTPIDTILKAETAALLFAGMIRLNL